MKYFNMSNRFWKGIRNFIPVRKSSGRPRKSPKKIMNSIFFILRTGIPWKALPSIFNVSASTVHRRYQEWIQSKVFFNYWKKILEKYQVKNKDMQKWLAIDSSTSKSPLGGEKVGQSPVDRKKLGTKKHICVDKNGIVFGISVSGANEHDNTFVQETVKNIPVVLPHNNIVFAADTAYDSKKTRAFLLQKNFIPEISQNKRRSKNSVEKIKSDYRWIIERTHSHLNNWRGIFIRWNKKVDNYIAAIQIAAVSYTFRFL